MDPSWILVGAQIGTSLFGARAERSAARAQRTLAGAQHTLITAQTEISGQMERFQLRRRAEEEESIRRAQLAEALGSQRASMAGAGVVGGRTQRLIEARSQAMFTRDQAYADYQTRMGLAGSRFQERMTVAGARLQQGGAQAQYSSAVQQSRANMWGGLLQAGKRAYNLWEDSRAATEDGD